MPTTDESPSRASAKTPPDEDTWRLAIALALTAARMRRLAAAVSSTPSLASVVTAEEERWIFDLSVTPMQDRTLLMNAASRSLGVDDQATQQSSGNRFRVLIMLCRWALSG